MDYGSPFKIIDNRKYNTWCKYKTRIDTYGCGCQHDCSYCYAKTLLSFRGHWDANNPKISHIKTIEKYIHQLKINDVIRMGSMTDCFQPLEFKNEITYKTIKLLNKYKIHYLIVTKSSMVSHDKYIEIYDKDLAHFQITITSTNDIKSLEYEKASTPTERIKSIEKLHKLGFDVSLRLSPFIYDNIDLSIINGINCDKILIEFLKVNHFVMKWFDIDYSEYTHKYGGYQNLELEKKIYLQSLITGFKQKSIGEYVREHHLYFSENINYNKFDCCNLTINKIFLDQQLKLEL